RLFLDFRRYMRVSPSGRVNLRLLAGGWVGGDALPLQQRLSMGGPDPLAGYGFRHSACNRDIVDPAFAATLVAACDRVVLAQAEYRGHISLHWSYGSSRPEDEAVKPLFTLRGPDLVVLGNAGQAWLVGGGPGRLPADRLPTLGSWLADLGLGLDWSGLGLWRSRSGWFDQFVTDFPWDAVARHDPLADDFVLIRSESRRVARYGTADDLERALELPYHVLSLTPKGRGRFYYVCRLEVSTLNDTDLEELTRWLKGDAGPAVSGGGDVGGALSRGAQRLLVRMAGLPHLTLEARSETLTQSASSAASTSPP